MTEPLYTLPNGKIYHANSLELLADLPAKSVDLFVYDPPWFDIPSENNKDSSEWRDVWKLPDPLRMARLTVRALKKSGIVYLFGYQPYMQDFHTAFTRFGLDFMYELIWNKTDRPAMGDGRYPLKAHANIWAYRWKDIPLKKTHHDIKRVVDNPEGEANLRTKPISRAISGEAVAPSKTVQPSRLKANNVIVYKTGVGYPKSVLRAGVIKEYSGDEYVHHPSQIPEALIELLVSMGSLEGDLVLDPFMGSGTTPVVCERLNRKWIGIEITKEWCDKGYKRILESMKKPKRLKFPKLITEPAQLGEFVSEYQDEGEKVKEEVGLEKWV